MAICGSDAKVSVDGDNAQVTEAHMFTISTEAGEFDVRRFSDDVFGSWIGCSKKGTIDVRTYERINIADGAVANLTANIGNTNLSATNCPLMSSGTDADAKGIVEFTYKFRLVGDITNW